MKREMEKTDVLNWGRIMEAHETGLIAMDEMGYVRRVHWKNRGVDGRKTVREEWGIKKHVIVLRRDVEPFPSHLRPCKGVAPLSESEVVAFETLRSL